MPATFAKIWTRNIVICLAIVVVTGLDAASITVGQPLERPTSIARAARSLKIADTAHLRLTKASGSLLHEAGPVAGTLAGSMRANLDVGASFSGDFTIYARGGTIEGHGTAVPHGSGRFESFRGSLVVTGGSGRYVHVHGHGGLFGTFDRRAFTFVVQTTGALSY